jgi:hypothetical protein
MLAELDDPVSPSPDLADLRDVLIEANINPRSGLATDYLNHFNEMVMLLELLPEDEGVLEDVLAWTPVSYLDYFAASNFRGNALAISTFDLVDPRLRMEFEMVIEDLDDVLVAAQDSASSGADGYPACLAASQQAAFLIAHASALIDAHDGADVAEDSAQAQVDQLFDD